MSGLLSMDADGALGGTCSSPVELEVEQNEDISDSEQVDKSTDQDGDTLFNESDLVWEVLVNTFRGLRYGKGSVMEMVVHHEAFLLCLGKFVIDNYRNQEALNSLFRKVQVYGIGKATGYGWHKIRDATIKMLTKHRTVSVGNMISQERSILQSFGDMMSAKSRGIRCNPTMACFLICYMKVIYDLIDSPDGTKPDFYKLFHTDFCVEETVTFVQNNPKVPCPDWLGDNLLKPQVVYLPRSLQIHLPRSKDIGTAASIIDIERHLEFQETSAKIVIEGLDEFGIKSLSSELNAKLDKRKELQKYNAKLYMLCENVNTRMQTNDIQIQEHQVVLNDLTICARLSKWLLKVQKKYRSETCTKEFLEEFVCEAVVEKLKVEGTPVQEEDLYRREPDGSAEEVTEQEASAGASGNILESENSSRAFVRTDLREENSAKRPRLEMSIASIPIAESTPSKAQANKESASRESTEAVPHGRNTPRQSKKILGTPPSDIPLVNHVQKPPPTVHSQDRISRAVSSPVITFSQKDSVRTVATNEHAKGLQPGLVKQGSSPIALQSTEFGNGDKSRSTIIYDVEEDEDERELLS